MALASLGNNAPKKYDETEYEIETRHYAHVDALVTLIMQRIRSLVH